MWKFFYSKYHIWLQQKFKLCRTGAHHVGFLCFSKDKSLELQYHQEQDKQQLRPSHIISVNYLDLAQAYATHEFQVQSKFLYQNCRIQNSGEFKAKNQALERNYNRATIHHVHQKFIEEKVLKSLTSLLIYIYFVLLVLSILKKTFTQFLFYFIT